MDVYTTKYLGKSVAYPVLAEAMTWNTFAAKFGDTADAIDSDGYLFLMFDAQHTRKPWFRMWQDSASFATDFTIL
jgi:hypothetical protein